MAQRQNCSYLAVKGASSFVYKPTNDWNIPEPGDLFDKNKSKTEHHRAAQRSTVQWLQEWSQIKVKLQWKRRDRYVPKRLQIASTAKTTLQAGLWPCGYTTLRKEAMMAVVARRSGGAPDFMRSVAAGPEPVLRPTDPDVKLRYYSTSQVQELLGLVHPCRKWSGSRKEQPVLRSRWVVLLVSEAVSDAALYMRPPGRPRKEKEEGKQETKQASKARKGKEETAKEEEEQEPAQKRRKRRSGGSEKRSEESGQMRKGDQDGGHGQCSAHHGAGWWSLPCAVDVELVCAARHCLVRGGQTAQTPIPTSPATARTLWCRWQARPCVVVRPRPMWGKERVPWGGPTAWATGSRGGGQGSRWERQGGMEANEGRKGEKEQ